MMESSAMDFSHVYETIYELTPLSLWLCDFSGLHESIPALKEQSGGDLRGYLEQNPEVVWELSGKVQVLNINQHALRLFECERKEEFFASAESVFIPESLPLFIEQIIALARGEYFFQAESPVQTVKGRRIHIMFATRLFPELMESRTIGLSWQIDITERKAMEEALQRSNHELEQFAYVASHDLQEPLRIITSFAELLHRRFHHVLDERGAKHMSYVIDGTKRMQGLINDLLALSRLNLERRPHAPVDCSTLIDDVLQTLEVLVEERGARITRDPLPTIIAEPQRFRQVFQNLIANALKFHGEKPPQIHIGARHAGHEWILSIADNGIGIPRNQLENIFAIFKRVHSRQEYPGSGIGLAIVRKIVHQHGGRVWVESEEGKGSTFYFSVPDKQP